MENLDSDWKNSDINVESLWIFERRENCGKHENVYHGNFVPQIPYQLLKRYTAPGDAVLEIFSGSGTTLFECEKLFRRYVGFDINEKILDYVNEKMKGSKAQFILNLCDVTDEKLFAQKMQESKKRLGIAAADFLIAHPPYLERREIL